MARPRLLDLFCGAGGAAMGYHLAGFDVVGVDVKKQPRYPFDFVQADAMTFPLDGFQVVHASPPGQHYSGRAGMHPESDYPDLVDAVRDRLDNSSALFVIENVPGAPLLRHPGLWGMYGVQMCGTSFGLGARGMELRRHRLFESNVMLSAPPCRHRLRTIGVYGHGGHTGKHRMAYAGEAREALGIDWMNRDEMSEAIPPAYTQFIGEQLLAAIQPAWTGPPTHTGRTE